MAKINNRNRETGGESAAVPQDAEKLAGEAIDGVGGRDYLSVREVAELAGVSYGTVRRAIEAGHLAAYRIGRKFFIEQQAAEEYRQRHGGRQNIEGYTIRELMARLSLSYAFLSGLIKSGELKSIRVGRQYIVTEEAFREFMERRRL